MSCGFILASGGAFYYLHRTFPRQSKGIGAQGARAPLDVAHSLVINTPAQPPTHSHTVFTAPRKNTPQTTNFK